MTHVATLVSNPARPALDEALVAKAAAALPGASAPHWLNPGVAAASTGQPLLFKALIDDAIPAGDTGLVTWLALGALALAIVEGALRLGQRWLSATIGEGLIRDLRVALFELHHRADVPDEVAIDEAIEAAKELCAVDAAGFVNGILGAAERARVPAQ